jgi:hypothetical protein
LDLALGFNFFSVVAYRHRAFIASPRPPRCPAPPTAWARSTWRRLDASAGRPDVGGNTQPAWSKTRLPIGPGVVGKGFYALTLRNSHNQAILASEIPIGRPWRAPWPQTTGSYPTCEQIGQRESSNLPRSATESLSHTSEGITAGTTSRKL